MPETFYAMINRLEDNRDIKALENSYEWLRSNPHSIKEEECNRRKRYVLSAIDFILFAKGEKGEQT